MSGTLNCGCDPDMVPPHECDWHIITRLTLALQNVRYSMLSRIHDCGHDRELYQHELEIIEATLTLRNSPHTS